MTGVQTCALPILATNHLALVTDLLDTRLDLHGCYLHCPRAVRVVSFVAVDDTAPGEVVGAELDDDSVLGQDADVVLLPSQNLS